MSNILVIASHALILALLLTCSHGILKWVSSQAIAGYTDLLMNHWKAIFVALAVYGCTFFYYILVLRSSPISMLYPIYTGLSVLFVLLVGRLVFEESLQPTQIAGALCILLGIILTGLSR